MHDVYVMMSMLYACLQESFNCYFAVTRLCKTAGAKILTIAQRFKKS